MGVTEERSRFDRDFLAALAAVVEDKAAGAGLYGRFLPPEEPLSVPALCEAGGKGWYVISCDLEGSGDHLTGRTHVGAVYRRDDDPPPGQGEGREWVVDLWVSGPTARDAGGLAVMLVAAVLEDKSARDRGSRGTRQRCARPAPGRGPLPGSGGSRRGLLPDPGQER